MKSLGRWVRSQSTSSLDNLYALPLFQPIAYLSVDPWQLITMLRQHAAYGIHIVVLFLTFALHTSGEDYQRS